MGAGAVFDLSQLWGAIIMGDSRNFTRITSIAALIGISEVYKCAAKFGRYTWLQMKRGGNCVFCFRLSRNP